MEILPMANRAQEGDWAVDEVEISAAGRHVVIIGGGDTGADCLGTSHRQGAEAVYQFEIMPQPPEARPGANPWPTWPFIYRTSSAHEEGGDRVFAVNTIEFLGDDEGRVRALRYAQVEQVVTDGRMSFEPVEGSEVELKADLVLLAMGFTGPETNGLLDQFEVALDPRGNVQRDDDWASSVPGVFVCGDAGRGQSLIVWAIAEGRSCAASVDEYLMGETSLPAPIAPSERPLV
jgi:glutamate synthase (NADPH/NADH) small chain